MKRIIEGSKNERTEERIEFRTRSATRERKEELSATRKNE